MNKDNSVTNIVELEDIMELVLSMTGEEHVTVQRVGNLEDFSTLLSGISLNNYGEGDVIVYRTLDKPEYTEHEFVVIVTLEIIDEFEGWDVVCNLFQWGEITGGNKMVRSLGSSDYFEEIIEKVTEILDKRL